MRQPGSGPGQCLSVDKPMYPAGQEITNTAATGRASTVYRGWRGTSAVAGMGDVMGVIRAERWGSDAQ